MNIRLRKFIGMIVLVLFVCLYALIAMVVAAAKLPEASKLAQWTYFVVVGFAWVIPAGALIAWMQKP